MERLRYTPNAAARQLVLQRSDSIGVVITEIASGFFASVLHGISTTAERLGYTTVFTVGQIEDRSRKIYRRMLEESRVDGLIIIEPWLNEQRLAELEALHKPIVLIQQEVQSDQIGSVATDNRGGAYAGMKHLLDKGYGDVLVIRGPPATQDSREREEGCRQAVQAAAGAKPTVRYIDGQFNPDRALEAFAAYREKHPLPRAIFALNDAMAIAILRELHRQHVKTPEDVAVMGYDGIDASEYFDLTTITTPLTAMGERAAELVHAKLQNPESKAQHVRLEGKLTVRLTA